MVLALLAGCRRDPDPGPPGDPPLPEGTFAEIAEALGYTVQPGALARVDDRDCCAPGAGCWFSNPTAPYLAYTLPPAPGQEVPDLGVDALGLAANYHLRRDEAVVLVGTAPPAVDYWGASSFVATRLVAGRLLAPRGATGPSVNGAALGVGPGEPYAVVTTMDAALEREVVRWLEASGVPAAAIATDRIPVDLVRSGFDPQADTFAHVIRAAGFAEPSAGEAWLADPGARLLRLTPNGEVPASEPHPLAPMPSRGSGTNEVGWVVAVGALGDAIRARFAGKLMVEVQLEALWVEPYQCIEVGYCGFDSSDRTYGRTALPFTLADGEVVVAYGVNHQRSGKAAYHAVAVHEVEHQLEIGSADHRAMVGSAAGWVDDPAALGGQADDLFAVAFARSCAGLPAPCIEIGDGCPGAGEGEPMVVTTRAYLEPATGTGPLASELVMDRAIKVFALEPPGTDTGAGDTGATPGTTGDTGGTR